MVELQHGANVLTEEAEVAATSPLKVNLVNPGILRTRMRAEAFPGEDPLSHPEPDSITDVFVDLAVPECLRTGEIVDAYSPMTNEEGQSA